MNYRHRSQKPAAALWLFVLGTDAVLGVSGAGAVVLWTVSSITAGALVVAGLWMLRRRAPSEPL